MVTRQLGRWFVLVGLAGAGLSASCGGPEHEGSAERDAGGSAPSTIEERVPESGAALSVVEHLGARYQLPVLDVHGAAGPSSAALAPAVTDHLAREGAWLRPVFSDEVSRSVTHAARVSLPTEGRQPFVVSDVESGVTVHVSMLGAAASVAEVAGGHVVYRGAHADGGDVVQRLTPAGAEDFVQLLRAPSAPEIAYTVGLERVAGLRLVGGVLEFLDALGAPRLRVRAPYVVGADGRVTEAKLMVEGCAVDARGAAPWGRAVTPPGKANCTVNVRWDAAKVTYPALVDPQWVSTGDMAYTRFFHTQTTLNNGLALVAGGASNGASTTASAELFDPVTSTFGLTNSMVVGRMRHTATVLTNGKVLIAGGDSVITFPPSGTYIGGEVYDPGTGGWTLTAGAGMTTWRGRHAAALLADGTVLITGGYNQVSGVIKSTDYYDPSINQFYAGPDMSVPRMYHTATAAYSGYAVVVTGGSSIAAAIPNGGLASAEYYDYFGVNFTSIASMAVARWGHAATSLADGSVLVSGGSDTIGTYQTSADLYGAPSFPSFPRSAAGSFSPGRRFHTTTLRADGRVLLAGGEDNSGASGGTGAARTAFLFTTPSSWSAIADMQRTRQGHGASLLANGDVLLSGGSPTNGFGLSQTAELYQNRAQGAGCATGAQCGSNYCVDNVCCDALCNSTCQACTAAKKGSGSNGTCGVIANGTDPDSECSDDLAPTCQHDGVCDGAGACRYYGAGTSCATSTCVAGTLTSYACTAGHACQPGAPSACAGNFACSSTSTCASSCTADGACIASAWCRTSDGSCQTDKSGGLACTLSSECILNSCVDGYCCDAPCNTACEACSAAKKGSGANGVCGKIAVGTDPDNECGDDGAASCNKNGACNGAGVCQQYVAGTPCGTTSCSAGTQTGNACNGSGTCQANSTTTCSPYLCATSSVCGTSCNFDADCIVADYCRTSDHTCQPDQAVGANCTSTAQCATGNCVDGYCCDGTCLGACQACSNAKTGQASGTCSAVTTGTDPDNDCPDDGQNSCSRNGLCGPTGCQSYAAGVSCNTTTCTGGSVTAYTCDGLGACKPGAASSCSPYLCLNATSCRANCATDADCVGAAFCSGGSCVPDLAQGGACTSNGQCVNGLCADGYCCNAPCNGPCQACSAAKKGGGANGTCGNVSAATDPDNDCATAAQSTCGTNGLCDGSGNCQSYALGTTCGASTCSGTTQTGYACNGLGACSPGSTTGCSPYTCGATTCNTSCTVDGDCIASYYCRTSDYTCQADQANGGACASGSQCTSANCVDGFCCDAPCSGTCQACSASKKGSGSDGVCGNVALQTDPDNECPTDAVSTCSRNGFCDGAGACRNYTLGTVCGATACNGGIATGSQCDGFANCIATSSTNCSPYTCKDATQCASTCSSDAQCIAGAYCDSGTGTCKSDQTNGASCGAASQCISGNCVDGVCCDQACNGACQACSAARKGGGLDGACAAVAVNTDPDNDCSDGGAATCQQNGLCNGAGACSLYALGVACGSTVCTNGTQTGFACTGFGACVSQGTACAPYTCNGTTCAQTCSDDAGCVAADYCRLSDGTCQSDLAQGAACTTTGQCATGNCVDGVCCDAPCAGSCQACSASKKGSGADGACGAIAAGSDPDSDCADQGASSCQQDGFCSGIGTCRLYGAGSACGATTCTSGTQTGLACDGLGTCQGAQVVTCSPYVCAGTLCGSSCVTDADCIGSAYCDASGTCQPDQAAGAGCSSTSQCLSGFCTDGVCCDQACAGNCKACSASKKGSGADGVCSNIATGSDPDNDCAVTNPDTCQENGQCDGSGACQKYAPGIACGINTCSGATQVGSQCNGFGLCAAGQTVDCSPYTCLGTSCGVSCSSDAECVNTAFCRGVSCQPKVANGLPCAADDECTSSFCVEGLCCNSACNGICQACTAANKTTGVDGVCGSAKLGVDPHGDCDAEAVTTCGLDGQCDGTGACSRYPSGTACGATDCSDDHTQTGHACTGSGICNANATVDCLMYACNSGACKTDCATNNDCAATAFCDTATSACAAKSVNGAACSAPDTCQSGLCVDGVCCDKACSGQCEACDVATATGTCSPVVGAPHVGRPACDPGSATSGDGACTARACDGATSTASCVGYVGSTTACRDQSCAAGVETFSATCDGTGVCGVAGPVKVKVCKPFACDATACKDTCTVDTDCSDGYRCDATSHQCTSGSTCDGDHSVTDSVGVVSDCAPFKCDPSGSCKDRCASSDECVASYVCNADQLCVKPQSPASVDNGGCGCRSAGERSPLGAMASWLVAGFVLAATRRRRGQRRATT